MNDHKERNTFTVEISGAKYEIQFLDEPGAATINGRRVNFDILLETPPDQFSLLINNRSFIVAIEPEDEPATYRVHAGGYDYRAEVISAQEAYLREFARAAGSGKKEGIIKAPMPGKIVKLNSKEGDAVTRNHGVMVMEAMKMENEIKSPVSGIVKKYHVHPGDAVEKGQVLCEIG